MLNETNLLDCPAFIAFANKTLEDNVEKARESSKLYYEDNKELMKKRSKQWRLDNPESYRKQNRSEKRKKHNRQWRTNNPECDEQYRKDNPEKLAAHCIANRAYPVPQICNVPGCTNIGERHHEDYSKPLEIEWLCVEHHKRRHSE